MSSGMEQSGHSDSTAKQQSDKVSNPNFDSHALLGEGLGLTQLKSQSHNAHKFLPPCTILDHEDPKFCDNNSNPSSKPNDNSNPNNANNNELNGTKIGRDSSGNITSYEAAGYSVSQHQDGKWYFHQDNKDGAQYVEVNNAKMDSNGKVTFHETGLFGKDGSIGGGEAPHETPTNGLAALQSHTDTEAHALFGDNGANALGSTVVDLAHNGKAALEWAAIQADKIPAVFQNTDSGMTPTGQLVLDDMKHLGLSDSEIWNGANVLLSDPADHGAMYDKWKNLPGAEVAISSHDGGNQAQYRIKTGPGDASVLFGVGPAGNTFFQMERHDCGNNMAEDVSHGLDWLTYKITDSNVGPSGISPRTDERPIVR